MASAVVKPWWRWLVYSLATLLVFFGIFWLSGLLAGGYLAWNGYSSVEIAIAVVFIVATAALTIGLAFGAIVAAQERQGARAIRLLLLSLLGAPLAMYLLNSRIFPL